MVSFLMRFPILLLAVCLAVSPAPPAVGEAVQAGTLVLRGATLIDVRGKFLLPGLIDTHVHLNLAWIRPGQTDRLDRLAKPDGPGR